MWEQHNLLPNQSFIYFRTRSRHILCPKLWTQVHPTSTANLVHCTQVKHGWHSNQTTDFSWLSKWKLRSSSEPFQFPKQLFEWINWLCIASEISVLSLTIIKDWNLKSLKLSVFSYYVSKINKIRPYTCSTKCSLSYFHLKSSCKNWILLRNIPMLGLESHGEKSVIWFEYYLC